MQARGSDAEKANHQRPAQAAERPLLAAELGFTRVLSGRSRINPTSAGGMGRGPPQARSKQAPSLTLPRKRERGRACCQGDATDHGAALRRPASEPLEQPTLAEEL